MDSFPGICYDILTEILTKEGRSMEKKVSGNDFADKLRAEAAQLLPKDLNTLESQRRMLQQLAQVILPVSVCANKAERDYWPQVEKKSMNLENAVTLCAADVNQIIRITVVDNLNLEGQTEESLHQIWAVLDYYRGKLEERQAAPIQALLTKLTGILQEKEDMRQKVEELAAMISAMEQLEEEKPAEETLQTDLEKTVPAEKTIPQDKIQEIPPTDRGGKIEKTGKSKKPLVIALVALVAVAAIVLAVLMPNFTKVSRAEDAIAAIGQVTLESGEAIAAAEQFYSELNESQQSKVGNYSLLTEARFTYECLVVKDAIETIGDVGLDSEEAIEKAEQLFDALSEEQRKKVGNSSVLTAARKEFERMTAAVEKAIKAIDAIGTVTLDSGDKISAARRAYDALEKDKLQSHVADKAKKLTDAEKTFNKYVTEDLYGKAMELYNAGKYEDALKSFESIMSEYAGTDAAKESWTAVGDCRLKLADSAFKKNDLYTAMKHLQEISGNNALREEVKELRAKVEDKLVKSRPRNGNVFTDKVGWGWCKLIVTAGNKDVCVRIISTENAANYMMFYVRAGESTEVNVKNGNYKVVFTSGDYWYNKDVCFGDRATYQCISGTLSPTSWISGSYVYYYEYELNLSVSSKSDFAVQSCKPEDFWG